MVYKDTNIHKKKYQDNNSRAYMYVVGRVKLQPEKRRFEPCSVGSWKRFADNRMRFEISSVVSTVSMSSEVAVWLNFFIDLSKSASVVSYGCRSSP